MPTSKLESWPAITRLVGEAQPRRILDVGPGCGKAGILLRECVGTAAWGTGPIERIDAIEAEPRYRDRHPWLHHVYDDVFWRPVEDTTAEWLACYDLVLMGDVLEHFVEATAADLLRRIPGHVIISTPMDWFQNVGWEDYPTETHRSHWTLEKLEAIRTVDRYCTDPAEHHGQILARMPAKVGVGSGSGSESIC